MTLTKCHENVKNRILSLSNYIHRFCFCLIENLFWILFILFSSIVSPFGYREYIQHLMSLLTKCQRARVVMITFLLILNRHLFDLNVLLSLHSVFHCCDKSKNMWKWKWKCVIFHIQGIDLFIFNSIPYYCTFFSLFLSFCSENGKEA